MAMEKGELRVARGLGEAGALVKEMLNVRITAGLAMGKVRIAGAGLLEGAAEGERIWDPETAGDLSGGTSKAFGSDENG
jgi:hypothetical protein